MRVTTLLKYLLGNKHAICEIASTRQGLLLGLLFVLSAGFAREYDGEDLLHEPWHLFIPLGASLLSSFLLYSLIWFVAFCRRAKNAFWSGYRVFLTLFWMTAPLAWLYAVPVERFLSAADSVRANLWFLGIVSVWRVALITRVVSVLYRCKPQAALFVVMLFADALVLQVLVLTPLPILSIMGGIRLTEAEEVLLSTAFLIRVSGFLSLPIWIVGAICVAAVGSRGAGAWSAVQEDSQLIEAPRKRNVGPGLWAVGGIALLAWITILPFTQREQRNRRFVETALTRGEVAAALTYMSQRLPTDFPPHWDPPPRLGYGEATPDIFDVLKTAKQNETAPWVRTLFIDKVLVQSHASRYGMQRVIDLKQMSEQNLGEYVLVLRDTLAGPAIAAAHESEIADILRSADDPDLTDANITETRRELLLALQQLGRRSEIVIGQAE